MRIATWNVNSVRSRAERVVAFLKRHDVDALAMQEIKCRPDQFPALPFEQAGYQVAAHGLDQWNGVAIASRVGLTDIEHNFPGQPAFNGIVEARALKATIGTDTGIPIRLVSLYIPNGRELDNPHYRYKLDWLSALRIAAANPEQDTLLAGDWNVAPLDTDVWDINLFSGATHVSEPERAAFKAFEQAGYREVSRDAAPGYSYWDYRQLRFPRNEGMRIDFMYASAGLATRVTGGFIDRDERKGKGASDHAPLAITLK
ncbi:MAG: exodeoxyribonuclease III [Varibaculum sp.]|nr:exodeoxyribonuclease III [Varibaculum sp.]